MQQHLEALHTFAQSSGLSMNLGKTKVIMFNITAQWVRRSVFTFLHGQEIAEYVDSYTYLRVVFSGPAFSLRGAAETRLTRGYASLG